MRAAARRAQRSVLARRDDVRDADRLRHVRGAKSRSSGSRITRARRRRTSPTAQPELAPYTELDALLQRCLAKQREERPRDRRGDDRAARSVEPTLARGVDGQPPVRRELVASSRSSYVEALAERSVARSRRCLTPGACLPTRARAAPGPHGAPTTRCRAAVDDRRQSPARSVDRARRRSRSSRWSWSRSCSRAAPRSAGCEATADHAAAGSRKQRCATAVTPAVAAIDRSIAGRRRRSIASDADAARSTRVTSGRANPEVASLHLDAAESARRAGNRLRQIAEADAALEARSAQRPGEVSARRRADHERRSRPRLQVLTRARAAIRCAVARARQAGCSTD